MQCRRARWGCGRAAGSGQRRCSPARRSCPRGYRIPGPHEWQRSGAFRRTAPRTQQRSGRAGRFRGRRSKRDSRRGTARCRPAARSGSVVCSSAAPSPRAPSCGWKSAEWLPARPSRQRPDSARSPQGRAHPCSCSAHPRASAAGLCADARRSSHPVHRIRRSPPR